MVVLPNQLNIGNRMESSKKESTGQHSLRFLLLLHLVPGIILFLGMVVFSQPFFYGIFGIDHRLGSVFGFVAATTLILVELAWLLYEGRKRNGRNSLSGIINYTEKSPLWQYIAAVPLLLAFTLISFLLVAPVIQPFIVDTFFAWWPPEYNFQSILHDPSQLSLLKGYAGAQIVAILYFIFPATTIAIVEELYFRGYLLPELEGHVNQYAPLLNVVLFSIYHFFSPWENPIRIIATLPLVYLVWFKKDIRYSILVHVLGNAIGGVFILFTVFN